MIQFYEFLYDSFLGLGISGYLGPLALVIVGFVLTRKDRFLGVLWFIVECLFIANYIALAETTPSYWWQIFILLLGGLFFCIFPLMNQRK